MVTTKGIAEPADPWEAPWATDRVRLTYARLSVPMPKRSLDELDDEPGSPSRRRTGRSASAAILNATGTTVVVPERRRPLSEPTETPEAIPEDYYGEPDPDLVSIAAEAAAQAAAERRAKRNA